MSFRRRKNAPFHSRLIRPPLAHNAVEYKIFAALSQRLYIYIYIDVSDSHTAPSSL